MKPPGHDTQSGPRGVPDPTQARSPVGVAARPENGAQGVCAEDLQVACDALVQGQRVKVRRDDESQEWQALPSLLQQLAGADGANPGWAGQSMAASKAPINTSVVALLADIDKTARRQMVDVHYIGVASPEMPRTVRSATTATIVTGDGVEMAAWLSVLTRWQHQIRRELKMDAGRRQWLRGTRCPGCRSVVASGADSDGCQVQTPALAVIWERPPVGLEHVEEQWRWAGIDCRACGRAWTRGVTMHLLIQALKVQSDESSIGDGGGVGQG